MSDLPTPDTWIEVKYDAEGKRVLRAMDGVGFPANRMRLL